MHNLEKDTKQIRAIITLIIASALLGFLYLKRWYFRVDYRQVLIPIFYSNEVYMGEWGLMGFLIVFFLFFGIILDKKSSSITKKSFYIAMFALMPLLTFFCLEVVGGRQFTVFSSEKTIACNLSLYYCFYCVILLFTNSMSVTVIVSHSFFTCYSVLNYYVDSFRGKPILPQDFVSVGAAADVASQYDWSITVPVCLTLLLLVALIVFWSKCNVRLRPRFRIISLLLSGLLLWYCKEEIIDRNRNNVVFSWWSPEKTFSENGYFLSFVHALQYLFPQLPEGYTEEYVQSLIDCSTADNSVTNQTNLIDVLPKNIIVIMEESWSDFHIYNNLKTDAPTTPVKDTLSGPTALTGNTHVSVYGGNTVNTEYEFLTGNTVAELPGEAIAYSLYMYEGMPSMVSCLSDLGYTTISYHPGSETTYNRKNVYRYLGFDNSYWEDSFYDNSYVRSLVSDESDFQHLIELCENSDSDRNFIFNVTIQNHASYDPSTINTTIHTISPHIATLDAYLSLVQLSDKAIGKLIDYFAKSEDKTVLLIFGDHQPAFSSSVYDAIGYSANENMFDSRFVTSAILWANYELPGALPNLDKVSVNFLASLLLKSIGVNLKGYPEFLQKLHLEYPVVSSAGCIDSQGEFNSYSKAIESSRVLQDYAVLQYNYIFDKDNKIDNYFWDCQS